PGHRPVRAQPRRLPGALLPAAGAALLEELTRAARSLEVSVDARRLGPLAVAAPGGHAGELREEGPVPGLAAETNGRGRDSHPLAVDPLVLVHLRTHDMDEIAVPVLLQDESRPPFVVDLDSDLAGAGKFLAGPPTLRAHQYGDHLVGRHAA